MPKKTPPIPINYFGEANDSGISIEKIQIKDLYHIEGSRESHRHDRHSFFLLEKGTVHIEIDFEAHIIKAPSVIYIHPNQVHTTTAFEDITVASWSIANENLNAEYLKLLESIAPTLPMPLEKDQFLLISDAASMCIRLNEKKGDKLYASFLNDSCNALIGLVISRYLAEGKHKEKLSRFETISKAFNELLERHYITNKRPSAYAQLLNVSTPYLNECVKNATGHAVSYHIQQRVILEAKRLLYYSAKSVKEIAADLGYDDYPYFSRIFTKVAGMTPMAFRNKNLD